MMPEDGGWFYFQNFELIESISALNNIMIAGFLEKKSKEEVYERTVELTQSLICLKICSKNPERIVRW